MLLSTSLPLFPLNILPLEQERVPLHIFEPRYRQLVDDLEQGLPGFGLLYAGNENTYWLGTYMTLVKVLKRYETGESDILCIAGRSFMMVSYDKEYPGKLYPGGRVHMLNHENREIGELLDREFREYMEVKQREKVEGKITLTDIANELDLKIQDRLAYLKLLKSDKRENFILERLKFVHHMLLNEKRYGRSYLYN